MVDVKVVATASPAPAWSLRSTRVCFIIGPLLHLFLKEIRSDGLDVTIPNPWWPQFLVVQFRDPRALAGAMTGGYRCHSS